MHNCLKVQIMFVKAPLLTPNHCKISIKMRDMTVTIPEKLNLGGCYLISETIATSLKTVVLDITDSNGFQLKSFEY